MHSLPFKSWFGPALLLVASSSCASPTPMVISLDEQLNYGNPPELEVRPEVWETTGDTFETTMALSEPAARSMDFAFEYEGPGRVTLPQGGHVDEGSTTIEIDGTFTAEAARSASQGTLTIYLVNEDASRFPVATVPVLHRTSIISNIEVHRIDRSALPEDIYYACLVSVDLNDMESEFSVEPGERHLDFAAAVVRQGRFEPEVRTYVDIDNDSAPYLPRDFVWQGNKRVVLVEVARPKYPAVKRAYLRMKATIGGDEHEKTIPLPLL